MTAITLTNDQENALSSFNKFLCDPHESVFVLQGYSGTGKTTLITTIIDRIPAFMKAAKLINARVKDYEIMLTATTNKAAENFSQITGMGVSTIHSFLGLRVHTDYKNNTTRLIPSREIPKEGYLLFIDEASYIDTQLLNWVFRLTKNCKIVFMGDPAQLTPVKSQGTPVFDANFNGAMLSEVVRQTEGNPILDLATKFRDTVNTGKFFQFKPDGQAISWVDRNTFNQQIIDEFTRPDWRYNHSKILAWTNKRVIEYNHFTRDQVKGDPNFQVGDYAICNKHISINRQSIKTDQLVHISGISNDTSEYGVLGNVITIDKHTRVFFPKSLDDKKARIKKARDCDDFNIVESIESNWIDLRAAYASTVNKAQGSTYDRVFIDLDDISRCNQADQLARMLYVAVSRARLQVIFTGDFV